MRDSRGKAFVVYVDPVDISTPASSTEFAGIASDTIPVDDCLTMPIKSIEYEGWLAFKEEPQATINWNTHTKPSNIAAISESSLIQQKNCSSISIDDLPF